MQVKLWNSFVFNLLTPATKNLIKWANKTLKFNYSLKYKKVRDHFLNQASNALLNQSASNIKTKEKKHDYFVVIRVTDLCTYH